MEKKPSIFAEKLAKLIDVKTILTLIFGIGYHVFIAMKIIDSNGYTELVKFIIYFYFGTQVGKAMASSTLPKE